MTKFYRIFIGIYIVIGWLLVSDVQGRDLSKMPQNDEHFSMSDARKFSQYSPLIAYISKSYTCGDIAQLIVTAPDAKYFKGDDIDLRRLIGPIQVQLVSECKQLNQIDVVGLVDQKKVYQGRALASKKWVLFPVTEQQAGKKGITINEQDELVVYQDKHLTIKGPSVKYASSWCGSRSGFNNNEPLNIRAFYSVDHLERDSLFSPGYAAFVQKNIVPAVKDYCGRVPQLIEMHMMDTENQNRFWDILKFSVVNDKVVGKGYMPPAPWSTKSIDKEKLDAFIKKMAVAQNDVNLLEADKSRTSQPVQQASAPKPVTQAKIQDISYDRYGNMIFYQAPGVIVKGPSKNEVKNWCEEASHLEPVPNQQTIYVELDEENLTSDIMDLESIFYPGIESFLASHVIPKMTKICQRPPDNFLMTVSFTGREFSVKDHFLYIVRDGIPVKRDFWYNKPFKSVKKGSGSFGYKSVEVKPASARLAYIKKMSMSQEDMQKLRGPVLFKDNKIEIYAHDFLTTSPIWPRWHKLDLVFNEDPFKLDHLLSPDYMASVLLPIVKKYHPSYDCSEKIDVFQFQSGSTYYWANVEYRFKDHDPACTNAKSVVAKLSGWSKAAREIIKGREDMRWGGCEKDGPFCSFSGGKYLNAIYRGDIKTVEQIDREVMSELPGCSSQKCSMLKFVADSYMYYFQEKCFQALGAKAVSKKFSVTTDIIQDDTLSGLPAQWVGGATISATYHVNPEFEDLMLRVGNAAGDNARSAVGEELGDGFGVLQNGVRQLQKQTGCKSPEIDQFEKNLIRLTTQYLDSLKKYK